MKLPVFKLEKFFEKYEFSAPYILCASDNETLSLKDLLAMADEESLSLWNDLKLGYIPVNGFPLLRQEIAKLYQNLEANEIATFTGAEEAIFILMNVVVKEGDHVIVPRPAYQSLYEVPKALGAEVSFFSMKERGGSWVFDLEDLEKLIRPNTRLIVLNFPHNPTGVTIDKATMEKIVALAKANGSFIFSDEVYRFSEHKGETTPSAADLYDKAISVGVMSKTFGLAGLRVGWLATKEDEILKKCLEYKCYLSICGSATSEILALMALRAKEKILERNLKLIQSNLDLLDRFFQKHSRVFAWKRPLAGSIAFPKLLLSTPIQEFVEDLLSKEGVLLLPGSVYEFPGNYFRIGFGRKDMPEALTRLDRYLGRLKDRHDERY